MGGLGHGIKALEISRRFPSATTRGKVSWEIFKYELETTVPGVSQGRLWYQLLDVGYFGVQRCLVLAKGCLWGADVDRSAGRDRVMTHRQVTWDQMF